MMTPLRRIAGTLGLLAATFTQAQTLAERYELQPLDAPDAAEAVARCVGRQTVGTNIEKFIAEGTAPESATRQQQIAHERGSAAAISARGRWACVPLSGEGFPIWPLETLEGLIVPVGVPAEPLAAWRRNMLGQVAREGVARGLLVYPNGNATQVNLIAEPRQAMRVRFTTQALKAGEFRAEQFPAVLQHPDFKSLVTRSEGSGSSPGRFAIPPTRLRKPLDAEFVRRAGNPQTGSFAFADTRWAFAGSGSELRLLADGNATMVGKQSSSNGTWRVDAGVLHVAFGSEGARFALTLGADTRSLAGDGRRRDKPTHAEDDGEWQWSATLTRQDGG